MTRPSLVPSPVRELSARQKRSNTHGRVSSSVPALVGGSNTTLIRVSRVVRVRHQHKTPSRGFVRCTTRDKHLAHSVNAFEITKAAARIEDLDTDSPEVETVSVVHVSRFTDGIDGVRWLVKMATYLQTIVYPLV